MIKNKRSKKNWFNYQVDVLPEYAAKIKIYIPVGSSLMNKKPLRRSKNGEPVNELKLVK